MSIEINKLPEIIEKKEIQGNPSISFFSIFSDNVEGFENSEIIKNIENIF